MSERYFGKVGIAVPGTYFGGYQMYRLKSRLDRLEEKLTPAVDR